MNVQTTSATIAGGQTQPTAVRAASPGERATSASPAVPMTTAGTAAHRWGRLVIRVEPTAIRAQPNPNPRSIDPVMTASVAPGKTTRARTRAVKAPATREPTTTPVTGRVRRDDAV